MAVVSRVDVGGRRLASLTFDDGPSEHTAPILDALAQRGARATFFVCGRSVAAGRRLLQRALDEGHELGNHTFDHRRPAELSDRALEHELVSTSDAVVGATGIAPTIARPPYGEDAARFARVAARLGLEPTVLWSIDPEDWADTPAAEIVRVVSEQMHPGAIVDLHDGRRAHAPTVDAVRVLVDELTGRGYALVTVSELVGAGVAR